MATKTATVILLTFLHILMFGQQTENTTYRGIQKFIAGDFDESIKFYTRAIEQDSAAFENYCKLPQK